jgi:hypothetical protein
MKKNVFLATLLIIAVIAVLVNQSIAPRVATITIRPRIQGSLPLHDPAQLTAIASRF